MLCIAALKGEIDLVLKENAGLNERWSVEQELKRLKCSRGSPSERSLPCLAGYELYR
jgi:hypothetical protein